MVAREDLEGEQVGGVLGHFYLPSCHLMRLLTFSPNRCGEGVGMYLSPRSPPAIAFLLPVACRGPVAYACCSFYSPPSGRLTDGMMEEAGGEVADGLVWRRARTTAS